MCSQFCTQLKGWLFLRRTEAPPGFTEAYSSTCLRLLGSVICDYSLKLCFPDWMVVCVPLAWELWEGRDQVFAHHCLLSAQHKLPGMGTG